MTRRIIILSIFLMLLATQLMADTHCVFDWLHLEAEAPHAPCSVDVEQFISVNVNIYFQNASHREITELSFSLPNLPEGMGGDAIISYAWEAQAVIGAPETGLTLTFDPPLDADVFSHHIGVVNILAIAEDWPGPDYFIDIITESSIDVHQQALRLQSAFFAFNCSIPEGCCCVGCGDNGPWILASDFMPVLGDEVGDSFTFGFRTDGWYCNDVVADEPRAYSGTVLVEGVPVEEFAGSGTQHFAFNLDAGDVPPGDLLHVEVAMELESGQTQSAQLEYLVSENTGLPPGPHTPISAVKALYR